MNTSKSCKRVVSGLVAIAAHSLDSVGSERECTSIVPQLMTGTAYVLLKTVIMTSGSFGSDFDIEPEVIGGLSEDDLAEGLVVESVSFADLESECDACRD